MNQVFTAVFRLCAVLVTEVAPGTVRLREHAHACSIDTSIPGSPAPLRLRPASRVTPHPAPPSRPSCPQGYATALSVIFTGIISTLFFGSSVDIYFVIAVVFVACSVSMYNQKR
mmetsp:Transcript_31786/g.102697  ORF Transcript_31786/g.102697 Transcript_31786/m.102697 type:complete len:114 (+) Transcript_31786:1306-1647(+)